MLKVSQININNYSTSVRVTFKFCIKESNDNNEFHNTNECQMETFIFVTTDYGSGTSNKYVAVFV
jgi:hypothetical protein